MSQHGEPSNSNEKGGDGAPVPSLEVSEPPVDEVSSPNTTAIAMGQDEGQPNVPESVAEGGIGSPMESEKESPRTDVQPLKPVATHVEDAADQLVESSDEVRAAHNTVKVPVVTSEESLDPDLPQTEGETPQQKDGTGFPEEGDIEVPPPKADDTVDLQKGQDEESPDAPQTKGEPQKQGYDIGLTAKDGNEVPPPDALPEGNDEENPDDAQVEDEAVGDDAQLETGNEVPPTEPQRESTSAPVESVDEVDNPLDVSALTEGPDEEYPVTPRKVSPTDQASLAAAGQDEENPDMPKADAPQHVNDDATAPLTPERDTQGETAFHGVLAKDPQQKARNAAEAKDGSVNDETGGEAKRRMPWAIGGIVMIVLIALGVSLGIVIPRRSASASAGTAMPTFSPSVAPTAAPSPVPTTSSFAVVAQAVKAAFGTILDDNTLPQYRAAEWMAQEDQLITSPFDDLTRFSQRYALVVFYYATGGDTSWTHQANFLSPNLDICRWQEDAPEGAETNLGILGVQCLSQGEVFGIEFIQNNLTGTLPDELGALSFLNALFLHLNSLEGTIPATIFNPIFQRFEVPFNFLTGTLPTEIGKYGSLVDVWLQESFLSGTIPSELGSNTALTFLRVSESNLNGTIPDTLLDLDELVLVDFANNNLTGSLPPDFQTSWTNAETLSFTGNALTGSPLPADINAMSKLTSLGLSYNNFTGSLPDSLFNISTLRILTLEGNEFTGSLPSDWSRMSALRIMSLASNKLTGALPASIGTATLLETANFSDNRFASTLPSELGSLTNIVNILLQENSFTGTVPETFRQWPSLRGLSLVTNELTGDMSFLCDATDPIIPWSPTIEELHADCLGEVTCPCCHICCTPDDTCESQYNE